MGRPPESEVYVRESSSPDPIEAPCTSGDVDGGGWLDLVPPERGPRIEIIDRLVQPDGRTGYQSLQPRGPNAWIVEAFDGVVLRLRSDGCFECQVRTDPEGSRGLRGDWTRNGDRVRITAEERTPGGFDVWLDGFLDRRGQDGAHDTWSLDALFSGGGGFTRLLARVRQPMTSSPLPPDFAGRIEHDGPLAPGRP